MLGFVGLYTRNDWTRDITLAHSKGIDGFVSDLTIKARLTSRRSTAMGLLSMPKRSRTPMPPRSSSTLVYQPIKPRFNCSSHLISCTSPRITLVKSPRS